MVLTSVASCVAGGAFLNGFNEFINQCASPSDISARSNIMTVADITGIIEQEQAIQTDLTTSLQGIRDLRVASDENDTGLVNELTKIQNKYNSIDEQIKNNEDKTEVKNQIFLQTVAAAPKKTTKLANLNDLALGIFFSSLIIFTFIITIIQATKTNGSLMTGVYTFVSMIVIIIVIYAIIKEVA